jgi:hypothetical protein
LCRFAVGTEFSLWEKTRKNLLIFFATHQRVTSVRARICCTNSKIENQQTVHIRTSAQNWHASLPASTMPVAPRSVELPSGLAAKAKAPAPPPNSQLIPKHWM